MISFRSREFKGSRLRCLLLTSQAPERCAAFFNAMTPSGVSVGPNDVWAPNGFLKPTEAKLGERADFLDEQQRQQLTAWWLAKPDRANTPSWDLVCTCRFLDRPGLVLIEAKAHEGECMDDRCGAKNPTNFERIRSALTEATVEWNRLLPGFSLSADSHYQLSNRFAFAWKVAAMGIPVVLVYLAFLDAWDMHGLGCQILRSHQQWKDCLTSKAVSQIPISAWDRTFEVNGTPLTVSIHSAKVEVAAVVTGNGCEGNQ